jgi:hypothetical protein
MPKHVISAIEAKALTEATPAQQKKLLLFIAATGLSSHPFKK